MAEPRYVIIHGHFYQPPRESPWTGLIAPEPSAAPFSELERAHPERMLHANAHAHTMEGTVVHVRNNYESIEFRFRPDAGRVDGAPRQARLSRDAPRRRAQPRRSLRPWQRDRAVVQSFDTAAARAARSRIADRVGNRGFRLSLRRIEPDGIWLPECAVDDATLESVAAAGLKFTILGARSGPFRWRGRQESHAPVHLSGSAASSASRFFVSIARCRRAVSFGDALQDGKAFADRLAAVALEHRARQRDAARDRRRDFRAS